LRLEYFHPSLSPENDEDEREERDERLEKVLISLNLSSLSW
jgi:hypothetical protein